MPKEQNIIARQTLSQTYVLSTEPKAVFACTLAAHRGPVTVKGAKLASSHDA